ncbi:hypothetical protein ABPG72_020446 [Tetrahymena utriculariae]
MQINSEYIILSEFKHNENIFLVSKGLDIQDKIFVLKYSGSSFLYPEIYNFMKLEDYFILKNPSHQVIEEVISQLCKICQDLKIHPSYMFQEGITFNHQTNCFSYPKQLINESRPSWEQNAFGYISRYLHENQDIEWNKKEQLYKLLEIIVKQSSDSYLSLSDYKQQRQNETGQIKSENEMAEEVENKNDQLNKALCLQISNQQELEIFLESKRNQYLNSVVFKHLKDKDFIQPESYDQQDFLKIQRYAFVYKEAGFHKLAKQLFQYYYKLLEELNLKMLNLYDSEQAQEVKVKIPKEKIIEYLEKLQENQVQLGDLLTVQCEQLSKEWHLQRKCRITASNYGNIVKSAQYQRNKIVQDQLYPKFFGNDATRYGNENESAARDKYVELKKEDRYEVKEFGLLIHPDYIWIAGSPDGIVYQDGKKMGCIEIKCPYKIKDDEKISYQKLDFLKKEEGQIKLKDSHAYYYQCQGIMKLSKVDWCDFIIYTKLDILVVRVEYDQEFVNNFYTQLHEYFFKHLLVENIYPCQSIHIKQQQMDEQQFEEIKKNNYIILQKNNQEQQDQLNYDEDQDQLQDDCSKTESITNEQEEQIDSTIPL